MELSGQCLRCAINYRIDGMHHFEVMILKVDFIPVVLIVTRELCVFTGSYTGDTGGNGFAFALLKCPHSVRCSAKI